MAKNTKINKSDINQTEQFIRNTDSSLDAIQLRSIYQKSIEAVTSSEKRNIDRIFMVRLAQLYARNNENTNQQSTALLTAATRDYPKNGDKILEAWLLTQAAFHYYSFSRYDLALPYFLPARNLLENLSNEKSAHFILGEVFMKNAFFAITIGDSTQVSNYLSNALKHTPETSKNYGAILNVIGSNFFNKGLLDSAMVYHEKSKISALRNNDSIRYAKSLGEMALIYQKWGESEKVIELLDTDIAVSKRNGDERNVMYAQILLGEQYLLMNDIPNAQKILNEAITYAESKSYLNGFEYQITEILVQIAQLNHDEKTELNLRRKLSELELVLTATDGKNVVNEINLKIQKENFDNQLKLEQSIVEKERLKKVTISIIAVLLLIGLFLVLIALRRKFKFRESEYQKMIISSQLEKTTSEKKLIETRNSLAAYQTYLLEKNEQISKLENEINSLSAFSSFKNLEKSNHSLEKLLQSHLMTDENWLTFKETFIREDHPSYQRILGQFPGITEAALRIEMIQALGLSNAETARLLGITIDAVKKSKQRLRKKAERA